MKSPNKELYKPNTSLELEAIPAEGWRFDHWNGYLTHERKSDQIVINSAVNLVAIFKPEDAPKMHPIDDRTVNEGEVISFSVDADSPAENDLTFEISNKPQRATFDKNTGDFYWEPGYDTAGTYNVTFTATDGELKDSETITITVNETNREPEFLNLSDHTIDEEKKLEFTVEAYDRDGDPLTITTSELPTGANFTYNNDGTGKLSWTPETGQAGKYNIDFTVSDTKTEITETITITVTDKNDIPPEFTTLPTTHTINEKEEVSFTVQAEDPDNDNNNIVLSVSNTPTGVNFEDNNDGTGQFSWTPSYEQAGDYIISFKAESNNKVTTKNVNIDVQNVNRKPVIDNIIANNLVEENEPVKFIIEGRDPDGDDLTFTMNSSISDKFNQTTTYQNGDTFIWNTDYDSAGNYMVSFTVSDGQASVQTKDYTIEVKDIDQAPEFESISDKTVTEGENLNFQVKASDKDGDPVSLSISNKPTEAEFTTTSTDNYATGSFDWTPGDIVHNEPEISHTVNFSAENEKSTTITINITVKNAPSDMATNTYEDFSKEVIEMDPDGMNSYISSDFTAYCYVPNSEEEYILNKSDFKNLISIAENEGFDITTFEMKDIIYPVENHDMVEIEGTQVFEATDGTGAHYSSSLSGATITLEYLNGTWKITELECESEIFDELSEYM